MEIKTWSDLSDHKFLAEISEIFFEASSKKNFESPEEKDKFFQKWLGKYLECFPDWTFLAVEDGVLLGYITGCPDSLKYAELSQPIVGGPADYQNYPAHLHINCHRNSRGKGVGGKLLKKFEENCKEKGLSGVHLITLEGEANVAFYLKNLYKIVSKKEEKKGNLLFMAKSI